MTDFSKQIVISADDGSANTFPQFLPTNVTSVMGRSASYTYENWYRFTNVTIPIGATINSAIVRFTSGPGQSGETCNLNVYFEDAAGASVPTAPSSRNDLLGRDLTSAVAWNDLSAWVEDSTYDTPDLTSILQDVIDLGGWASGQALQVHIRNNGSSVSAFRTAVAYDGTPADSAELIISYNDPVVSDDFTVDDQVDGFSLTDSAIDSFTIDDSIVAQGGSTYVTGENLFTIDDSVSGGFEINAPLSDDFTIDDSVVVGFEYQGPVSENIAASDLTDAFEWTQWLRENYGNYWIRYYVTLTGEADNESDQILPHSSFQSTKRNGEATFLSVIVPGFGFSSEITARSNGDLRVEMAYIIKGVENFREIIIEVDLENIRLDEGVRRRSITLSGSRTFEYKSNLVLLENPIYKYVSDGKIRYRFLQVNPWLNPGDVVQCRTDEYVVEYITYIISDRFKQMEVSEI